MIISLGYDFTDAIFPLFETAMWVFLTVCLLIFAVRLMMGGIEKIPRTTFEFVLKFATVVMFVSNLDVVMTWSFDILDGLLLAVSDATQLSTGYRCGTGSAVSVFTTAPTLWERIDCMLDIVIGISSPRLLADGMLAFFFYNIFSGAASLIMGLIGLWITFNLVLGIFKAIETYLLTVFTIVILVIIGILFIPLVFVSSVEYFKNWFKLIGGAMVQPVVMFAYLNVVMAGLDVVLYSGEHSVFRTYAGVEVDQKDFRINDYIEREQLLRAAVPGPTLDQNHSIFNSGLLGPMQGLVRQTIQSEDKNALSLNPEDIAQMPLGIPVQGINWEKSAEILDPPLDKSKIAAGGTLGGLLESQVFAAMLVAALVSYILLLLLNNIHYVAAELSGKAKYLGMGMHQSSAIGRFMERDGSNTYFGNLTAQGMTNKGLGKVNQLSDTVRDSVTGLAGGARAAAARKAAAQTAAKSAAAARTAASTVTRPGAVAKGAAAAGAAAAAGTAATASAAGGAASAAASRAQASLAGKASGATQGDAVAGVQRTAAATTIARPGLIAPPGSASASPPGITNVSYTQTGAASSQLLSGAGASPVSPAMQARMSLQQKVEEEWEKLSEKEKEEVRARRAEEDRQREAAREKEMEDRRNANGGAIAKAADALGVDRDDVRVNANGTLTIALKSPDIDGGRLAGKVGAYGTSDSITINIEDADNELYLSNLKAQVALTRSEIADIRKNAQLNLSRKDNNDDEEETIREPLLPEKQELEAFERQSLIRDQDPFAPKDLADMTPEERERALNALYYGTEALSFTVNGQPITTNAGKLTADDIDQNKELFASIDQITGESTAARIGGGTVAAAAITETIRSPFDEPVTGQAAGDVLAGGAGGDTLERESIRTPFDAPVTTGPDTPREFADMSPAERKEVLNSLFNGEGESKTFMVNGTSYTTTKGEKLTIEDAQQNPELMAGIADAMKREDFEVAQVTNNLAQGTGNQKYLDDLGNYVKQMEVEDPATVASAAENSPSTEGLPAYDGMRDAGLKPEPDPIRDAGSVTADETDYFEKRKERLQKEAEEQELLADEREERLKKEAEEQQLLAEERDERLQKEQQEREQAQMRKIDNDSGGSFA